MKFNIDYFLYVWGAPIITSAGFLLSCVLSSISLPKETPAKHKLRLSFIIIVTGILTSFATFMCHKVSVNYATVPDIKLGETPAFVVFQQLGVAGISYDVSLDNLAMAHKEVDGDISSFPYKVYECDPAPGTFVQKGDKVKLKITWIENYNSVPLPAQIENFDAKTFYEEDGFLHVYRCVSRSIRVLVVPVSLKTVVGGVEGIHHTNYPAPETFRIVEAQLINYDTGRIVSTAAAYLGDEILFSNVQNGTYYYVISCAGYKSAVSKCLLQIEDPDSFNDYGYQTVGLELPDKNYSAPFQIQIFDSQGNELRNMPVKVRTVDEDDPYPEAGWLYSLVTDDSGYLTQRPGDYQMDGGLVEFSLCAGYILEVALDTEEEYVQVTPSKGDVTRVQLN